MDRVLLRDILAGRSTLPFPKSALCCAGSLSMLLCDDKPNALVVDFFAGSGTTLQCSRICSTQPTVADRRCILVTNNEVSEDEARA